MLPHIHFRVATRSNLKTTLALQLLLCLLIILMSIALVSAADFYIYNASLSPTSVDVGQTSDLSVSVYAHSFHSCQVTVSSDSGVNILVPTRDFQFGGTYTGSFGIPYDQEYFLDFQVVALGYGDHTLTVNYYVEGNLVDSRQVTLHVVQYTVLDAAVIAVLVALLSGFLILVRKRFTRRLRSLKSGGDEYTQAVSDATLAKVAKEYGGVLTKTVMAYELGTSLDEAQNALDRYVKHGEARRVQIGEMSIYDIPSARIHLLGADKIIVELTINNKGRISRTELLRESGQSLEALDAGLNRLERQGILVRNPNNTYRLAVVS